MWFKFLSSLPLRYVEIPYCPMIEHIRWGILGTGRIANAFAEGLSVLSAAELKAVGSRNRKTAIAFAEKWRIANRHASYESLASDQEIDAVYIATPHTEHASNTVMCLEAGKAVLCEKPMAVNAKQIRHMVDVARTNKTLLMEGMWSRFPPGMAKVRELVANGTLGRLRSLQADFGFKAKNRDPKGRLLNLELAGGSLLDIGIYPISLSSMLFGKPKEIVTTWHKGETGVDEQAAYIFRHAEGALSIMHSSLEAQTSQETVLAGSEAKLKISRQCWRPQELILTRNDESEEYFSLPFSGNGFNYEAAAFMELLRNGQLESDVMPLDESISIMETLDEIRAQWGLRYPFE